MKIDFCLPAYNEEEILESSTLEMFDYFNKKNYDFDWQIILVINGSSDRSMQIASELSQKYIKVKAYEIKAGGKGRAIKNCWQKSQADYFVYMDIDLAVSLDSLDLLISSLKNGYDLVWGSRLLKASVTERGFFRTLSSRIFNIFSRTLLKHSFTDLHCGFKGINNRNKEVLLNKIENDNWFFDTELVIWAKKLGYKLKEIPVNWKECRYQKRKSKVKVFKVAKEQIIKMIELRKKLKNS